MSILVSILLFYTVIEHSVMVSARGCPGSTCISPVWLDRCKLSLSLSLSTHTGLMQGSRKETGREVVVQPPRADEMDR